MTIKLGPYWLELLPGFSVHVKPLSRLIARQAVMALQAAQAAALSEGHGADLAVLIGDDTYNRAIAKAAIIDWAGDITTPDGQPAKVTPENIDFLLDQVEPAQAFNALYVMPFIEASVEKNASSPSSNGSTPTAEADTAADASSPPDSPTVPESAPS